MRPLLARLRSKPNSAEPPGYPAGRRIYCIGDIHGRLDLLQQLHVQIEDDARGYSGQLQLLYLGDYIDRGHQSREVLDLLIRDHRDNFEQIFLLGNHEQALLDFLIDPLSMASWLGFGGVETLRSYGVHAGPFSSKGDLLQIRDELGEVIPEQHLKFIQACTPCYTAGDYYFVHAGIRPGIPLEKQSRGDQLWIREDFTQSNANHGAIIVHGHTISEQAEFLANRIGIDTGAFRSGVLTCLVLEGSSFRLLQTGKTGLV